VTIDHLQSYSDKLSIILRLYDGHLMTILQSSYDNVTIILQSSYSPYNQPSYNHLEIILSSFTIILKSSLNLMDTHSKFAAVFFHFCTKYVSKLDIVFLPSPGCEPGIFSYFIHFLTPFH